MGGGEQVDVSEEAGIPPCRKVSGLRLPLPTRHAVLRPAFTAARHWLKPSPYPATQGKPPAPLAAPYNTDGEGIGNPQRDGEEIHRRRESADAGNPGNSSGTSI